MKILSLCCILFFTACSEPSVIKEQLKGSDSLLINFNKPKSDIIDKTVTTTEQKAIKELIRFADGDIGKTDTCSYDGNMVFFKKGTMIADIAFNYTDCRHFMLMLHGALTPIVMSNKAADFLKSLHAGRNWY